MFADGLDTFRYLPIVPFDSNKGQIEEENIGSVENNREHIIGLLIVLFKNEKSGELRAKDQQPNSSQFVVVMFYLSGVEQKDNN